MVGLSAPTMRALAVDRGRDRRRQRVWQTTCTLVRAGAEGFLIDSPVLPDEIEALPAVLEQAGFPLSGLLCTHGDWDHLLARLGVPRGSLGVGAGDVRAVERPRRAAVRELREFDEEQYIDGRAPLGLGDLQALPVPGVLSLGETDEIDMYPASGHTADGTAFWMPWLGVLVCGDYLSPLEIPMISPGGSAEAYLETLRGCRRSSIRRRRSSPGMASPLPRGGPARPRTRTSPTSRRCWEPATRRCPTAGTPTPNAARTRATRTRSPEPPHGRSTAEETPYTGVPQACTIEAC